MSHREVMQQALEALELAKLNGKAGMYPAEIEEIAAAITALRAALAEPQDEPVAWRYWSTKWHSWEYSDAPPVFPAVPAGTKMEPLYTHPAPQRQPLTEDETMILMNETAGHYWADEAHIQRFRAAIEKAHGIGGKE